MTKEADTTLSPSLNDLRDRQQVFIHQQGEHFAIWLFQWWKVGKPSNWGPSLGTIGLTKGLVESHPSTSLWRWLLLSMKAKYLLKEDTVNQQDKQTMTESGQYLRELMVMKLV